MGSPVTRALKVFIFFLIALAFNHISTKKYLIETKDTGLDSMTGSSDYDVNCGIQVNNNHGWHGFDYNNNACQMNIHTLNGKKFLIEKKTKPGKKKKKKKKKK